MIYGGEEPFSSVPQGVSPDLPERWELQPRRCIHQLFSPNKLRAQVELQKESSFSLCPGVPMLAEVSGGCPSQCFFTCVLQLVCPVPEAVLHPMSQVPLHSATGHSPV